LKQLLICLILCIFSATTVTAQPHPQAGNNNKWTGTAEEKLWGLMTIWAQTKYAFPYRDRLNELDWDGTVRSFIPRVMAAEDEDDYYKLLMELVALLRDSHTEVIPPWGRFTPGYDIIPIEVMVIDDKFYIVRTGNTEEIARQNISPGMEILEVGDGVPVRQYFEDTVLKYHSRGSKRTDETVLLFYLFYGPQNSTVKLTVRDRDGAQRTIELTRNATSGDGAPFFYTFVQHSFAETIESRLLPDGILYVNLPNFQNENTGIRDDFLKLIDTTDLSAVKGMIIDVRYNLGGSHSILHPIVGCLIDSPVSTPAEHYLQYTAAKFRGGDSQAYTWNTQTWEVAPRDGVRYLGPLVALIGPCTHSSGEDMIIELSQTGRCVTIGEPTAGGAGDRLTSLLPGGGQFTVSTFKSTYPDGREYMAAGIQPDFEINRTITDIIDGNDRVLKKAIEVITNWEKIHLESK